MFHGVFVAEEDDRAEDKGSVGTTGNIQFINLLKPNVNYSGHTALLTSKVAFYIFIQQI